MNRISAHHLVPLSWIIWSCHHINIYLFSLSFFLWSIQNTQSSIQLQRYYLMVPKEIKLVGFLNRRDMAPYLKVGRIINVSQLFRWCRQNINITGIVLRFVEHEILIGILSTIFFRHPWYVVKHIFPASFGGQTTFTGDSKLKWEPSVKRDKYNLEELFVIQINAVECSRR